MVGSVARFRLGDDRFVARILEPGAARFELALPPPPCSFAITDTKGLHGRQLAEEGARVSELPRRDDQDGKRAAGALIRRLEVPWPRGARRLTVLLLPDYDTENGAVPVAPLDHWLATDPKARLCRRPSHNESSRPDKLNVFRPGARSGSPAIPNRFIEPRASVIPNGALQTNCRR